MKKLTLNLLLTVSVSLSVAIPGFTQNAVIKLTSGDQRQVHINASSDSHLFVAGGSYDFATLDSVAFEVYRAVDAGLYEKLLRAGVKVTAGGVAKYNTSPVVVEKPREPLVGYDETDRLEKFEKQRAAGKFIQLVGAAALSTSVYLLAKYRNDDINAKGNYEPKKGPAELAIAGGALIVIGFGIDIEAGRHLKKKR